MAVIEVMRDPPRPPAGGGLLENLADDRGLGLVDPAALAFRTSASWVRWRAFSRSISSAKAVTDSINLSGATPRT
jgi:hypothetical protein